MHYLGAGAEAISLAKRMKNPHQIKVLQALCSNYDQEFPYFDFGMLIERTGLTHSQVKRSCRVLKRRGLAQFKNGLWHEDGTPAGSGYAATSMGRVIAQLLDDPNESA